MEDFISKLRQTTEQEHGPTKEALSKILETIKNTQINVLLVGGTGVGKSSTINALFHTSDMHMENKATVGESANPETMGVTQYKLKNVVIWDTPGLGDSTEKDQQHQEKITELLNRKDNSGKPLMDLIFLVLDGTSRDFSSAYKLIKEVVAPNLQPDEKSRLLIGINKADKVMHHKFWDEEHNQPKPELVSKLNKQAETVKKRISEDTGFSPDVIYYSAGETHDGELIQQPYNLTKLLSFIIDHLPKKKRAAMVNDMSKNSKNFESNDDGDKYQNKIKESFLDSLVDIGSALLWHAKDVASEIYQKSGVKEKIIETGTALMSEFLSKVFKKGSK